MWSESIFEKPEAAAGRMEEKENVEEEEEEEGRFLEDARCIFT